jgi:hypothetical protein
MQQLVSICLLIHLVHRNIPFLITVQPPEGIPTLTSWWGLCGHVIPRATLAVVYACMLLVGPPMPDRSRVMTQTKRDTMVLQVGGLAWG